MCSLLTCQMLHIHKRAHWKLPHSDKPVIWDHHMECFCAPASPPKVRRKRIPRVCLFIVLFEFNLSSALILKYRTMIQSIRNVLIIINILLSITMYSYILSCFNIRCLCMLSFYKLFTTSVVGQSRIHTLPYNVLQVSKTTKPAHKAPKKTASARARHSRQHQCHERA